MTGDAPAEPSAFEDRDALEDGSAEEALATPQPPAPDQPPGAEADAVDAEDARAALEELDRDELTDWELEIVIAFTRHPEPDIRAMALRALAPRAGGAWAAIRRCFDDPDDAVRAEAVRTAGADPDRIPDLIPVAAERRWPAAQLAALEWLARLAVEAGEEISDADLRSLLMFVGQMASAPVERERGPLLHVLRSVGLPRVAPTLQDADSVRLGAVRLLMAERSIEALRLIASLSSDPIEEIRTAAITASAQAPRPADEDAEEPEEPAPPAEDLAEDLDGVRRLARDLLHPDDAVQARAMAALGEPGWTAITSWARRALASEDPETASLAATLAERLHLVQAAPMLLERAASTSIEEAGPFLRALRSFELDPRESAAFLQQIDPSLRADAVPLLWEMGGRPVLPHLMSSVAGASAQVRVATLRVVSGSDEPAAFDLADRALADDLSADVRAEAVRVLADAGRDRRLEALERAMEDPQPVVRALAIEHLTPPDPTADRRLLAALDDPVDEVADAAIRALVRRMRGDPITVWAALQRARGNRRTRLEEAIARERPEALERLSIDPESLDVEDRVLAAELAIERGGEQAVDAAVRALADPSAEVRRTAVRSLRSSADPRSVDALREAVTDPSSDVRMEAVRALAEHAEESSIATLIRALGDPDIRVRDALMDSLRRLGSRALAVRLIDALDREDARLQAIELLAEMGRPIERLLVGSLPGRSGEGRAAIGELLRRMVGLDEFSRRLGSLDRNERSDAVDALAAMGTPDGTTELIRALGDPDEEIRIKTVRALAGTGDARAVEAVRQTAREDPVAEVADSARDALRVLESTAAGARERTPFDR